MGSEIGCRRVAHAPAYSRESALPSGLLPTIIDTPENRAAMPGADPARWVAPGDLANVILFLASSEAAYITGQTINVDGGMFMN